MHDQEMQNIKSKVVRLLAEYIGVEPEDIKSEDSLIAELHMQPTDLSEFQSILEENSFDTSKLDLTEIETVEDLCENLL